MLCEDAPRAERLRAVAPCAWQTAGPGEVVKIAAIVLGMMNRVIGTLRHLAKHGRPPVPPVRVLPSGQLAAKVRRQPHTCLAWAAAPLGMPAAPLPWFDRRQQLRLPLSTPSLPVLHLPHRLVITMSIFQQTSNEI